MANRLSNAEIGHRIAAKREQVGISPQTFAEALGVSPLDVARIESGTFHGLSGDLVLIAARVLQVDFRYFVTHHLDQEDAQTGRVYRALTNPTPEDEYRLRLFFHFAAGEVELRDMLDRRINNSPPAYSAHPPTGVTYRDHGRDIARLERRRLGLGDAPIGNIFARVREEGVRLQRQRFPNSALSGLTATHPRAGTCVLVNYTDDLYRQMFSAAHEYAHVLLDRPTLDRDACVVSYEANKGELVEVRANAFAAEFMLPRSAMLAKWSTPTDDAEIERILILAANRHFVNTETVLFAMRALGWLGEGQVREWKTRRPRIARRDKIDPDVPPGLSARQEARLLASIERGLDRRFVELVAEAVRLREITVGRAGEFLAMHREEVLPFFSEVGV